MAKKFYASNNSLSDEVVKWYASVNNLSKKVVKAYCSVNGFSKLFYEKGGGGGTGFWFFYETVANEVCLSISGRAFYKTQDGIAFFAIVWDKSTGWVGPFFFSTDVDAVKYGSSAGSNPSSQGSITYNNETWYWMGFGYSIKDPAINPVNIIPFDSLIEFYSEGQQPEVSAEIVLNSLLPRVYSNDFAEDYQDNQTYNLIYADKRKTFKRILGIFLYKNAQVADVVSSVSYRSLLSLVDTIASDVASQSYSLVEVMCNFWGTTSGIKYVEIDCHYSNADLSNKRVWNKSANEGYTRLNLVDQLSYIKTKRYWINENEGTLRTEESTSYSFSGTIGAIVSYNAPSQYERGIYYHAECTNIGLVL